MFTPYIPDFRAGHSCQDTLPDLTATVDRSKPVYQNHFKLLQTVY